MVKDFERHMTMRTVTGAILIAAAEQAFSHAHLVGFPHGVFANQVLLPASLVLLVAGLGFLVWGVLTERASKELRGS
jgi:hypothetical protein